MSYTRVTETERTLIASWLQAGKSIREAAGLLGRPAGTLDEVIQANLDAWR